MLTIEQQIQHELREGLLSQKFKLNASISPSYTQYSLLNLPGSLFKWFRLGQLHHPPLQLDSLDALAEGVDQIILILVDAVAYARAKEWLALLPAWQALVERGLFVPLTSITPSTTCNVLTTLWTGRSPVEHAILGYELFLKEYGIVANMITHNPMAFKSGTGGLYQAGFDPETALPVETIGPALNAGGVEAHTYLHYTIANSGLSRMHYRGIERHSFGSAADLWLDVRHLAEQPRDKRFIWVYHGAVDGLSHRYGPDSEQARIEFLTYLQGMYQTLIEPLSKQGKQKTLFLLTADHGQVHTPQDPRYDLANHPDFLGMLHIKPTGENRLMYFHPRPGNTEAVADYIHHAWPGDFVTLTSTEALELGLFGPGTMAQSVPDRIGDLIAFPTGNAYLWWADQPNPLLGRHGAFDPLEMLVPLLAVRLD